MSNPTPAAPKVDAKPQRKQISAKSAVLKDYRQRLKDNIRSLRENFQEIIRLAKIEEDTKVGRANQHEQEVLEMQVRTANMAKAGENLIRLISDLKEFLILNDFAFANQAVAAVSRQQLKNKEEIGDKIASVKDDALNELYEFEQQEFLRTAF